MKFFNEPALNFNNTFSQMDQQFENKVAELEKQKRDAEREAETES